MRLHRFSGTFSPLLLLPLVLNIILQNNLAQAWAPNRLFLGNQIVKPENTLLLYNSKKINLTTSRQRFHSQQTTLLKEASTNNDNQPESKTGGRAGGRKSKKNKVDKRRRQQQGRGNHTLWWQIPAVLLSLLLLKGILFDSSDHSFVYYESSVYESRTYNSDGRVETSRKENFRSNIPSLVEQSRQQRNTENNNNYLEEKTRMLEEDMIKEINSAIRLQNSILDEIF